MTEIRPSFARLFIDLQAEEPMELASYKGPMLRGALGSVFRSAVCVRRSLKDCDGCAISECPYKQVFESVDPLGRDLPRPFVIEPPDDDRRIIPAGDRLRFGLVLFGRGLALAPLFIMLFDEAGKIGLGRTRARCSVHSVIGEEGENVYVPGGKYRPLAVKQMEQFIAPISYRFARIRFLTPTSIRREGEMLDAPSPRALLESATRRVRLLYRFHSTEQLRQEDVARAIEAAASVKMTRVNVARSEVTRFSTRQQMRLTHVGFTGEIALAGHIAPLYPWLKAAGYLHIGKGCTFGLGRLVFEAVGER